MPNTGCTADDRGRAGYELSRSPGAPRSRPASSGLDLLARDGSARTRAWRRPTGQGWSAAAAAGENEASSGAAAMIAARSRGGLTKWRTVRVLVSSTFLDMHAERNHFVRASRAERELMAGRRCPDG